MNIIKSIFISTFAMVATIISFYAGAMIYAGENPIAWGGVMLTTAPFMTVISWLIIFRRMARTSDHFPVINFLSAIGVAMAIWSWSRGGSGMAPLLAIIGWSGFLLYSYWYSIFGRRPSKEIKVGAYLPDFTLRDVNGATVSSSQLTDKPTVLIFYRGNWCPLCVAQVKEVVRYYKEMEDLGVRVALISPQPQRKTAALSKKFNVKYDFLIDHDNLAAHTLGLVDPYGLPMGQQLNGYKSETVLPTVIITERGGKIIWTHETDNYRVRPEPVVFLEVLRRHLAGTVTA